MSRRINISILVSIALFSNLALSGDLDDGIEYEKNISDELKLDKNMGFIILKAKSKANSGENTGCEGVGNIKVGAGATIKGDIVNVSKNNKTTSVCIVK